VRAERDENARIEAATTAFVKPGDPQSEKSASYTSDQPDRPTERTERRSARGGTGWFTYTMSVDGEKPMALLVTYYNEPGIPPIAGRFVILVDGTEVARFAPNSAGANFYTETYRIPPQLTAGKTSATVKFEADSGGRIAPVYGVRLIRALD
jgi:hypothetical protein